jgi:hypothetical protein
MSEDKNPGTDTQDEGKRNLADADLEKAAGGVAKKKKSRAYMRINDNGDGNSEAKIRDI